MRTHLRKAFRTAESATNCPCLEARRLALSGNTRPFHGIYIDVWHRMRPAVSRALAYLRSAGLVTDETVLTFSPFNGLPTTC